MAICQASAHCAHSQKPFPVRLWHQRRALAHNGQHLSVAWVDSSITVLLHQSAELVAHPIRIIGTNRWPLESHAKSHSAGGSKSNDPVAQRSLPVMTIVSRVHMLSTAAVRHSSQSDESERASGGRETA